MVGWSALILSLLLALVSFYTSHKGLRQLLTDHANGPCDIIDNRWIRATVWINLAAGLSCVAGILLTAVFAYSNFIPRVNS